MPLTTTSNREDFVASSGQTVFAYTFRADLATDLQVFQEGTLLTLITNYTVSGLGNPAGGNITLVTGASSGDAIAILRVVPLTQLSDYVQNEGLPANRVEADYEKLTMIAQQHEEQLGRTVSLLSSSLIANLTMPDPVASNYIRWRSDLTGFDNVELSSLIGLPLSSVLGSVNEVCLFGAGGTSIIGNNTLQYDGTILTARSIRIGAGGFDTTGRILNQFAGDFTSTGTFNVVGTHWLQNLQAIAGNTNYHVGLDILNNLLTQDAGESIATRAQVRINRPGGTIGASDTLTNNTVLWVIGPGTGGSATFSDTIFVDGGAVRIREGELILGTVNDGTVHSPQNMDFNIDSDDTQANVNFIWGTNRIRRIGGVQLMSLTDNSNLVLGTIPFPANPQPSRVLYIEGGGIAPVGATVNAIGIFALDSTFGAVNATLALRLEETVQAIGTFTPSHKLRIWINGVEYDIQLDAVI